MAKGLRATTRKRNKRALRATVFGPAYDARIQRLSTKLQELAAQPRPEEQKKMEVDETEEKPAEKETASNEATEGTYCQNFYDAVAALTPTSRYGY